MSGEPILRALVLVLFSPAIGAAVAYAVGHPSIALLLNAAVPLLVFLGSGLAILNNPTRITAAGVLYFAVPLVVLLACAAVSRVLGDHGFQSARTVPRAPHLEALFTPRALTPSTLQRL